jgi:O-antigen biosynthesis protein
MKHPTTNKTKLNQVQADLATTRLALQESQLALNQTHNELADGRAALALSQSDLSNVRTDVVRILQDVNEQKTVLHLMRNTLGWRLSAPLRHLKGLIHNHVLGFSQLVPIPINHLEGLDGKVGHRWNAVADDPQFLLRPLNPAVLRRGQWFYLKFQWKCETPVTHQLYIDYGTGYQGHVELTFNIEKSGAVSMPLYLPKTFRGLRLDPMTSAGEFSISNMRITQSRRRPDICPEHEGIIRYLQAIDGAGFQLLPFNDLQLDTSQSRHWQSIGSDPHFLLKPHSQKYPTAGWYSAELCIHSEEKHALAKFYFDTGSGFNETETLTFLYASDELMERIYFIDKPVQAIRFDPKEVPAGFRIDVLRLNPLPESNAVKAMARRLIAKHEDYAGLSPSEVMNVIAKLKLDEQETPVQRLTKIYNETFQGRQSSIDYEEWIKEVEQPRLPSLIDTTDHIARLSYRPLISIVMPVYNTPENYLREAIESVLAQTYPHWELCIADDASPKRHVQRVLQEYALRDPRIRVVRRSENGHISRASNSAIEMAQGDYLALMDHDDTLPPHALYYMACAINEQSDVQIIYSDEDKIDTKGQRFDPHFKSDWNPDLFFSQNYVSHLGVYRRDLINRIGGFRTGVEGSQDQDLLLRCLPHVRHDQITHIPRVLYHWRMAEGSTALASGEKSYTTDAGIKSLRDFFSENGPENVTVETGLVPNTYRVRWPIPKSAPSVTLIMPTRDRRTITELAVRSILALTTYSNYEIVIIDNGSVEPETLQFFEQIQQQDSRVKVLRYDHPFNYSAINNFGVKHTISDIVGLINNDVEVINPDWLSEMVSHASRADIGCVGAKLYFSNNTLQHGGVILSIGGVAGHSHKYFPKNHPGYFTRLMLTQNLSAVTAACVLIRREVYEQVGGLDEENLKVAFNDVDFCLKVREAGYRNLWTPYAELYHHESISRGTEDNPEKVARFNGEVAYMQNKWSEALAVDPFYNPNLTRQHEDFSIG